MSGKDLIDDYLSELMDDPGKGKPVSADEVVVSVAAEPDSPASESEQVVPPAEQAVPADPPPATYDSAEAIADPLAAFRDGSPNISDDEFEAMLDALEGKPAPEGTTEAAPAAEPAGDPLAAFRDGSPNISDDEFEAMLDALEGKSTPTEATVPDPAPAAEPAGDPLAAFREGSPNISDDEFEAMLDALEGKSTAAEAAVPDSAPTAPPADPLAAFRDGAPTISDDEFEAMLDAMQGQPGAPASVPTEPGPAPVPAAAPAGNAVVAVPATPAIEAMLPPRGQQPLQAAEPAGSGERRRRADDRITSWLRFALARQCFAVEVLKVQEVLRVPHILPVRGTAEAMLGVMNLRGQIVPVMDLAIKLGFPPTETNDASRVIVLEENGETLGVLVASVADVVNMSDGKMERISGTPSLVAAEVVRGISRRDGQIIIMLDATRLLA